MATKKNKAAITLICSSVIIAGAGIALVDKYLTYQSNISSAGCCGWVDSSPFIRPLTHLLVDWSEPVWTLNADQSQEWLVSDGLVNGKKEFWTVWEKRDPNTKQDIN